MITSSAGDATAERDRPEEVVGSSSYEVGVAIIPVASAHEDETSTAVYGIPGFDETLGWSRTESERRPVLVVKGEEAVRAATQVIANQIGLTAQRITAAIEAQIDGTADEGSLALTSVQVSFGVTLSTGLQAMFTAQAESSAQVTITLSRQPG